MTFSFTCPHCGSTTEVDQSYAGQTGPCFSCGKEVKLPEEIDNNLASAQAALHSEKRSEIRKSLGVVAVSITILIGSVAVFAAISFVVLPLIKGDPNLTDRKESARRLSQISQALNLYHDTYGSYPPAVIYDSNGLPMHSWRVLILPFLDEQTIYDQYKFDEPWNGPNNSMLINQMPPVFASPANEIGSNLAETSYMVIVGPNTPFPPKGKTVTRKSISDGTQNTILVAEIIDNGTIWISPTDLVAANMVFDIDSPDGEIESRYPGGAQVAMANDDVVFLPDRTSRRIVRSLTTANGDEGISVQDIPPEK